MIISKKILTTSKVCDILYKNCNTSIGLLKEDAKTLRIMINYLNDNF